MTGHRVRECEDAGGSALEETVNAIAIDFDEHGRRTFATRLVTLQATNEPAPNKAPARKRAVKKKKES